MELTPETIRRLFRELPAASNAEFEATTHALSSEPGMAFACVQMLHALASTGDRPLQLLFEAIHFHGVILLLLEEMKRNREFEQRMGRVIAELMRQLGPPPRGKPKPTRTA